MSTESTKVNRRRGAAQEKKEAVMADETTEVVEGEEPEATTKKSKKTPVPEGYMSPVDFAKHLSQIRGEIVPPQIVYGYIKNSKEFPFEEREGMPRFIVNVAAAEEWAQAQAAKKAEREAKKAEAAKATAEAAS